MGQAELSRKTLKKVKKAAAPSSLKVDDGPPPFLLHQSVFCVTILASDELTGLGPGKRGNRTSEIVGLAHLRLPD
jgi:hypothetical protein